MNEFIYRISAQFYIVKAITDAHIYFNGCRITQDKQREIKMDMSIYMKSITSLNTTRNLRKQAEYKSTHE